MRALSETAPGIDVLKSEIAQLKIEGSILRTIIDGAAGEIISTILKDNDSPDEIKKLFVEHPIFALFALEMADWFAAAGGKNYVEVLLGFKLETKDFIMTIQKKSGKTPHELRKELEAELARLRETAGTCKWKLEDEGENLWKPSCSDELWHFIDVSSDPIENGMKYCPFCGHVLEIVIEPIQPEPQEYE